MGKFIEIYYQTHDKLVLLFMNNKQIYIFCFKTTFLIDNKKVFGTHLMQDMIKDALRCFVSPPVLSSK